MAHLPGAIHFVAQSPEPDLPGRLTPILLTEPGHSRIFRRIAVFHPLLRLSPGPSPEIGADIGLGAQLLYIIEKFVGSETVRLHRAPCHLRSRRTLVRRADAARPVVVGGEI